MNRSRNCRSRLFRTATGMTENEREIEIKRVRIEGKRAESQ